MSNLGDLMRTFANETNANLEAVIMQTGIKMVDSLLNKSPVDTGRFRGGDRDPRWFRKPTAWVHG